MRPDLQESAGHCPATEGAISHERSGSVLQATTAVWRDFTPGVRHRRSKTTGMAPGG